MPIMVFAYLQLYVENTLDKSISKKDEVRYRASSFALTCSCRIFMLAISSQMSFSVTSADYFLYPHLGQTPFSFSAIPQRGQRSMVPVTSYS